MAHVNYRSFIRACIIASVVFAITFVGTRAQWFMAGAAGFAAGYLSYRFRDVLAAIPEAIEATSDQLARLYGRVVNANPLEYVVALCGLFGCIIGIYVGVVKVYPEIMHLHTIRPHYWLEEYIVFPAAISLVIIAVGESTILPIVIIGALIKFGAHRVDRCFWPTSDTETRDEYRKQGLTEKPLTYDNVGRWLWLGIGLLAYSWTWKICRDLAILLARSIGQLFVFSLNLLWLIHSSDRILAGIGGVLGGAIGCYFFYRPDLGAIQSIVLFFVCGIIGAAGGAVYYQIAQCLRKLIPRITAVPALE